MPFQHLRSLPAPQRHTVLASAFTLFLTLAAHQLMETARDSLFLQHVPATRLPWMYLVIAVLSLGAARSVALARHLVRPRVLIVAWIVLTAAVTFTFSALTPRMGREWMLYALYIWTGIASTVTLLQFWQMLGGISSIQDAKRSFAVVGTGTVMGAIAGSIAATSLAEAGYPDTLLTLAGALFLVSALGPLWLGKTHGELLDTTDNEEGKIDSMAEIADDVFGQPYVRSLLALVTVSMATLTLVDFVFKSTVAAEIEPAQLTEFFAWFYLVTNAISMIVQMVAVEWILRRLTVTGALAAMPVAILAGSISFIAGVGIAAVAAMKGVDGVLRHSLNKTATEVLYVPMKSAVRRRVKAVIDVLGHRGAQAAASLGILLALQLGVTTDNLGYGLVAFAVLWLGAVVALRVRYVDVFRDRIKLAASSGGAEFPELDIDSLESLVRALSDPDDARVITAIDILEEENRADLIPTLLVHHPSELVVLRAFEVFASRGREDFLSHVEKIIDHPNPSIRAEVVTAIGRIRGDADFLWEKLEFEEPTVAAVAAVFLAKLGELDGEPAVAVVEDALFESSRHHAVARALTEAPTRHFERAYLELLSTEDPEARRVAVEAADKFQSAAVALKLRDLLTDRHLRPLVRDALVSLGAKGRLVLQRSIGDTTLPLSVRWQIPEALEGFGSEVAPLLWEAYQDEQDGVMRHRILIALTAVTTEEFASEIRSELLEAAESTLRRAWEMRHWARIVEEADHASPHRRLLVTVLRDKQEHATDLGLRLVALSQASSAGDFASIRDGLRAGDELVRVSSRELLEHVVDGDLRRALIGLYDDDTKPPDSFDFISYSYPELIRRMVWGDSQLISAVAVRIAATLDDELVEIVRERRESADPELQAVIGRALEEVALRGEEQLETA